MKFLAFISTALLGAGPLVSGRPQGASAGMNQLQSLYDSMVATNPVLPARPSSPIPDGQTYSDPITLTGKYFDSPVSIASVGTDPIGLHLSTGQLGTDQSQTSQLPTDLLTAYKSPAGPPAIDQSAFLPLQTGQLEIEQDTTYQPATYHFTSGGSNTPPDPSHIAFTRPVGHSQDNEPAVEIPPVSDPPLEVTQAITTSFKNLMANKCSFGIYGVAPSNIDFEVKGCGDSTDLASFSEQILINAPCLGVRRMRRKGQTFSILYYEGDDNEIALLKYSRPDFEATLRQTTNSKISQKTAKDKTTLLQILGLS